VIALSHLSFARRKSVQCKINAEQAKVGLYAAVTAVLFGQPANNNAHYALAA
jgi:hypothetical protein